MFAHDTVLRTEFSMGAKKAVKTVLKTTAIQEHKTLLSN